MFQSPPISALQPCSGLDVSDGFALRHRYSSIKELRSSRYGAFKLSAQSGYNNSWKDDYSYKRDNTIGINYSIPLFTGFETEHKINAAKYKRQEELSVIALKIQGEVFQT
jgi:outer membrane protein TolC